MAGLLRRAQMRIVISSPPKMGNKWIKCLLSQVYDLEWIVGEDSPDTNIERFMQYVSEGRLPDNTIFHQHCRYNPSSAISSIRFRLISSPSSAIRMTPSSPCTTGSRPEPTMTASADVSARCDRARGTRGLARHLNGRATRWWASPSMIPLSSSTSRTSTALSSVRAAEWVHSGRAIVVRYEDLHRDPVAGVDSRDQPDRAGRNRAYRTRH